MRVTRPAIGVVLAAALGAGCGLIQGADLTGPSDGAGGAVPSFSGTWASTAGQSVPLGASCGDFEWRITEASADGVQGTFAATCAGNVRVSGTGSGALSGTTLNWNMSGTATPSQGAGCPFTLSGAAVPEATDAIRVHYSGTVCGVAVSGSEILNRR